MRTETERLLIRSFSISDVPAYAEIVADPRVTKYLGDGSPHTSKKPKATYAIALIGIARRESLDMRCYASVRWT